MSISIYERNIKYGQTSFIAGILMLFDNNIDKIYSIITGILMIIGSIITIIYYNKQITFENRKEIILNYLENNIIIINKKNKKSDKKNDKKIKKSEEYKIIDNFSKKYKLNKNKININNLDKIIYIDINYNNLTLFLDIFTFVKKYQLINDLNIKWNKLLDDYYQHYNNIIAFISNLDNTNDINIAIDYLIDDYNNNAKILDNLIREILVEKNKSDWLNEKPIDCYNIIKYMSTIFNYIISDYYEDSTISNVIV